MAQCPVTTLDLVPALSRFEPRHFSPEQVLYVCTVSFHFGAALKDSASKLTLSELKHLGRYLAEFLQGCNDRPGLGLALPRDLIKLDNRTFLTFGRPGAASAWDCEVTVFVGKGEPVREGFTRVNIGSRADGSLKWRWVSFSNELQRLGVESLQKTVPGELKVDGGYHSYVVRLGWHVSETSVSKLLSQKADAVDPEHAATASAILSRLLQLECEDDAQPRDLVRGNRIFSHGHPGTASLPHGLEHSMGINKSLRLFGDSVFLSTLGCHRVFYQQSSVADFVEAFFGPGVVSASSAAAGRLALLLQGLTVTVHAPYGDFQRAVSGVSPGTPDQTFKISAKSKDVMTVASYYTQDAQSPLRYPNHPCVDVGAPLRPNYVPTEYCHISPWQKFRHDLPRLAQQSIGERLRQWPKLINAPEASGPLESGADLVRCAGQSTLKTDVFSHIKSLAGRPWPQWKDAFQVVFVEARTSPVSSKAWTIFKSEFASKIQELGLGSISKAPVVLQYGSNADVTNAWTKKLAARIAAVSHSSAVTLLVVGIPDNSCNIQCYRAIKTICDLRLGLQSYCVNMKTLERGNRRQIQNDDCRSLKSIAHKMTRQILSHNHTRSAEMTSPVSDVTIGVHAVPINSAFPTDSADRLSKTIFLFALTTYRSETEASPATTTGLVGLFDPRADLRDLFKSHLRKVCAHSNPRPVQVFRSGTFAPLPDHRRFSSTADLPQHNGEGTGLGSLAATGNMAQSGSGEDFVKLSNRLAAISFTPPVFPISNDSTTESGSSDSGRCQDHSATEGTTISKTTGKMLTIITAKPAYCSRPLALCDGAQDEQAPEAASVVQTGQKALTKLDCINEEIRLLQDVLSNSEVFPTQSSKPTLTYVTVHEDATIKLQVAAERLREADQSAITTTETHSARSSAKKTRAPQLTYLSSNLGVFGSGEREFGLQKLLETGSPSGLVRVTCHIFQDQPSAPGSGVQRISPVPGAGGLYRAGHSSMPVLGERSISLSRRQHCEAETREKLQQLIVENSYNDVLGLHDNKWPVPTHLARLAAKRALLHLRSDDWSEENPTRPYTLPQVHKNLQQTLYFL
ncbi:hypothetical protein LTR66_011643 [Elasticomyces elasticus]|nr:hypothetical protein LTR66_011643 [Elasticomyces elasticus]